MSIETPSQFLRAFFGAYSEAPVFLVSLPNTDEREGQAGPKEVLSRDPATIDGFVQRWDRKGRGLYFCVGTIKEGAMPNRPGGSRRNKENLAELVTAHAEVDTKEILCSLDEVIEAVWNLPHPPSITIRSGNGLHLYWLLSESLSADSENIYRLERLNEQLGELVGGDDVQDATRLLRVPFTHNTKKGAWKPVEIVEAKFEPRYEIDDLEEMVANLSPVVKRKPAAPRADGGTTAADNPFLRVAAEHGYKPALDVKAEVAGLALGSINQTLCRLTASLSSKGVGVEDIVEYLMPAVERANRVADGDYPERKARHDERLIRNQCASFRRKNPGLASDVTIEAALGAAKPIVDTAPSNIVQLSAERAQARAVPADETISVEVEGRMSSAVGAEVVSLADEKAKRAPAEKGKKKKGPALSPMIADGVIEVLRSGDRDILLTEGEIYLYAEGVWRCAGPAEHQYLKTLIQRGCDAYGCTGEVSEANAAWKRITEHPDLYVPHVPWGGAGYVVLANGMLALSGREFGPWRSDVYCRTKVDTMYDPDAKCPIFLKFLDSLFLNLPEDERAKVISAIQEFFGSALCVPMLHREERKGLLAIGPSRSGKTQLSLIFRKLVGARIASPSIADISTAFGLSPLLGADAWVRDDAVSEGDKVDPARLKVLITGESVEINRKGLPQVTTSLQIPIFITTNVLPKARDTTDALYNRFLVLDMKCVVAEEDTIKARVALGVPENRNVADFIAETEMPGILNWALDGLERLRARGRFDLPRAIKAAIESFKQGNNPVAEWAAIALEAAPGYMVSRSDLRCCFNGWERSEHGDEARASGGKFLLSRLRQLTGLGIDVEGPQLTGGERYVLNVRLTEDGKRLWKEHHDLQLRGGSPGSSSDVHEINRAAVTDGDDGNSKTEFDD
jgi:P4 family phage/plasmid primase-like protien